MYTTLTCAHFCKITSESKDITTYRQSDCQYAGGKKAHQLALTLDKPPNPLISAPNLISQHSQLYSALPLPSALLISPQTKIKA